MDSAGDGYLYERPERTQTCWACLRYCHARLETRNSRVPSILWKRNSLSFPWYFPEKVLKFNEKYFLVEVCYIHKSHYNQSVNEHNLHMAQDAHTPNWRKPFPSGSLSQIPWVFPDFWCFPQIPWVFPDWKIGNSFSRFSLISRVAGNPEQIVQPSSGQLLLDYHARVTSKTIREPHLFQACVFSWVKNQWAAGQDSLSCFQCLV